MKIVQFENGCNLNTISRMLWLLGHRFYRENLGVCDGILEDFGGWDFG